MDRVSTQTGGPDSSNPIRELLHLCRRQLLYATLFSAFINIAYLAPTLYMLSVYDMVVPSSSGLTLLFLTLLLAATLWTLTFLERMRTGIMASAGVKFDATFAPRLFQLGLDDTRGGRQRLGPSLRQLDTLRGVINSPAATAALDAPWIPINLLLCFYIHVTIGLLGLVGALVLLAVAAWNERATREPARQALQSQSLVQISQQAVGAAPAVVRSLGMTGAFLARFEQARIDANRPSMWMVRAQGRASSRARFLRLLLQSLGLGLAAWLAINHLISAGAIFASSMLIGRSLAPIDQAVAAWRPVSQAVAAYGELRGLLRPGRPRPRLSHMPEAPQVSLARLSVASPDRSRLLLAGVTLSINPGEVIAVVGPNGAGKSLLLEAIANARSPDQGEIRMDGVVYEDLEPDELGRTIGYVPQDGALFAGSILDNISRFDLLLGGDKVTVERDAIVAAKEAGVHDSILQLADGYHTMLGAGGSGLSQGQRKRIALARAAYGTPRLLVLDEADAGMDQIGEAAIGTLVQRVRARGGLVVFSAHRTGLLALADKIAVLEDGRMTRFGPRQEVLSPPPAQARGPRHDAPRRTN